LTANDGASTLPFPQRPRPFDVPRPDVFTAVADEFFVEWQVADATSRPTEKQRLYS